MEMQIKNSSSSRPLKQPSKRVLVKIIPGPNESALITGGALATLGHIDKAAALRARYMAYKRVDRRLQASQIDTGRRTRDNLYYQKQRADLPEKSKIDSFQPQRIFGRDDCIYDAMHRIIWAMTLLLRKEASPNEVTKKPTRGFTRGPPYSKTSQSLN